VSRTLRLASLALLLTAAAGRALTQEPAPPPPPEDGAEEAVSDPAADYPGARRRHYSAARLLLGLPGTGRQQAPVYEGPGFTCLVEMNMGDRLNPSAVAGLAGGGRLAYLLAGGNDRPGLSLGPGLDLWAVDPAREAVVAPTLDVSLGRQAGPLSGWEVSLHLGQGYFCGHPGGYGFPDHFPLLGLSAALRY
jgi:hypothetical protein